MELLSFAEFQKLDLRVALVTEVEEVAEADKLYKLTLDVGELGMRTILAGVKQFYKPTDLKGKMVVLCANLAPRVIRGVESQGMLLAADNRGKAVILRPHKKVIPGAQVR